MLQIIQIINTTIAVCVFGFSLGIWGAIYYYKTDSFFKQEFDEYKKELKNQEDDEDDVWVVNFILFMIPFSLSMLFVFLQNPAMAGAMLFFTGTASVFYNQVYDVSE